MKLILIVMLKNSNGNSDGNSELIDTSIVTEIGQIIITLRF